MIEVTVSSKGQVAIPKAVRDALNLAAGTRLAVELRGQQIVLSRQPAWKALYRAGAGKDLTRMFAAEKKREREREDSRP